MKKTAIVEKSFNIDYPENGEQFVGSMYGVYKKGFEAGDKQGFINAVLFGAQFLISIGEDTIAEQLLKESN